LSTDEWERILTALPERHLKGDDFRIQITQGPSAFTVMQRRRIPSEFLTFPDESRWVLKPRLVIFRRLICWSSRSDTRSNGVVEFLASCAAFIQWKQYDCRFTHNKRFVLPTLKSQCNRER